MPYLHPIFLLSFSYLLPASFCFLSCYHSDIISLPLHYHLVLSPYFPAIFYIFPSFSCANQKNVVILHRKPKVCRHSYKKRLFAFVLELLKSGKFPSPKTRTAMNAHWYVFYRADSARCTYQRGRYCLFLGNRFTRTSIVKNKHSKVPRFLYIFTGRLEPMSHHKSLQ